MKRLSGSRVPYTVSAYLGSVCPWVAKIKDLTCAKDVRSVDRALFALGAAEFPDE